MHTHDIIKADEKDKTVSRFCLWRTAGWWTGFGGLGFYSFFIADLPNWQWSEIYFGCLLGLWLYCLISCVGSEEPVTDPRIPSAV